MQCTPDFSCQQDPNVCGSDASCVVMTSGQYECQCNEGFTGNGIVCKSKCLSVQYRDIIFHFHFFIAFR
jgi:hypothetical protein